MIRLRQALVDYPKFFENYVDQVIIPSDVSPNPRLYGSRSKVPTGKDGVLSAKSLFNLGDGQSTETGRFPAYSNSSRRTQWFTY